MINSQKTNKESSKKITPSVLVNYVQNHAADFAHQLNDNYELVIKTAKDGLKHGIIKF